MFKLLLWTVVPALVVVGLLLWVAARPAMFARRVDRARRQFARDRAGLESVFFAKAAASGKPRGLAWKSCAFQDGVVLARDRATSELVGLVGVTIGFEAIAGGGMEDVEAVGNLRAATAVFTYGGGAWTTSGRVVFNLEPDEVLERFGTELDPIG
jgi:hypothetical protein